MSCNPLSNVDMREISIRAIRAVDLANKAFANDSRRCEDMAYKNIDRIAELTGVPFRDIQEALNPFQVFPRDDRTYKPFFNELRSLGISLPTEKEFKTMEQDKSFKQAVHDRFKRKRKEAEA